MMDKRELAIHTYEELQKRRKKIKRNAIILVLFLFVVNSYAWFVYFAKASLSVDANIVGWDIKFYNEDATEMDIDIIIRDLYPGMQDYQKKIIVTNNSNLKGQFSYEVSDLKVLDKPPQNLSNDTILASLQNDFPFIVTLESTKDILENEGDFLEFYIRLTWPFESENPYRPVTSRQTFQPDFIYYQLVDGNYQVNSSITNDNFLEYQQSGLYIESDQLDSYWGEQASLYAQQSPNSPSLSFHLHLSVEQLETN